MNADSASDDPIFDLELRIARRADQLAAACSTGSSHGLECWLKTEAEELGDANCFGSETLVGAERA